MTTSEPPDDFVITFNPEATPEEKDRFLDELAHAIMAIARHVVETEPLASEGDEFPQVEI